MQREDFKKYVPLVRSIAHKIKSRLPYHANVDVDDLIQTGMVGLLEAMDRYEETPNAQFESYATWRIRGAIYDELRDADWLPHKTRESVRQANDVFKVLVGQLGRRPTIREVAAALGISVEDYEKLRVLDHNSKLVYHEEFEEPMDFLDENCVVTVVDTLTVALGQEQWALVADGVEKLSERDQTLLELYYDQELNLREIGSILGVSESRACQLCKQAIKRLRAATEA